MALVAPFIAAIDDRRPQIGGAQSIVAGLGSGLAARGHRVTILAARGSHVTGATVIELGIDPDPAAAFHADGTGSRSSQDGAFQKVSAWLDTHRADFDVVHGHAFDAPAFDRIRGPRVVHSLHLPPMDPAIVAAVRRSDATLATVSDSCRRAWNDSGVVIRHVLANGIAVDAVPEGRGDAGHLAFVGRMSPEKGVDVACRVARALDLPLRLAGVVYDSRYFEAEVRPLLGPRIELLGALDRGAVLRLLGTARATLMPVRWDEPFGLVALESLATGTPVVAYARGGLTEIIVDRRNGRLIPPDDESAFTAAVQDASAVSRADCRADARRFDLRAMLDAHEAVYRGLCRIGDSV